MKNRELRELLKNFDPEAEIYSLDSCSCCTGFVKLKSGSVAWRGLDDERYYDDDTVESLSYRDPPSNHLPFGLVIAGGGWANPHPADRETSK